MTASGHAPPERHIEVQQFQLETSGIQHGLAVVTCAQ